MSDKRKEARERKRERRREREKGRDREKKRNKREKKKWERRAGLRDWIEVSAYFFVFNLTCGVHITKRPFLECNHFSHLPLFLVSSFLPLNNNLMRWNRPPNSSASRKFRSKGRERGQNPSRQRFTLERRKEMSLKRKKWAKLGKQEIRKGKFDRELSNVELTTTFGSCPVLLVVLRVAVITWEILTENFSSFFSFSSIITWMEYERVWVPYYWPPFNRERERERNFDCKKESTAPTNETIKRVTQRSSGSLSSLSRLSFSLIVLFSVWLSLSETFFL